MSAEFLGEDICPCCPDSRPDGFVEEVDIPGLKPEEMDFNEQVHLELGQPEVVRYLDQDLHHSKALTSQLATNYGCCSAFRVMSDEGCRVIDHTLRALEKYATSSPRIPKFLKGSTFRSRFMHGLAHSPAILRQVSQLAGCELIYHPMRIQQLHTNFKPDESKNVGDAKGGDNDEQPTKKSRMGPKKVDKWHIDTTALVLVLFCTDPDEYEGGELQYFSGTREEGIACLTKNGELPADRVFNVGRQHKGYGVFMQGSRVFHQVSPVLRGDNRTTMVFSFQPKNVFTLEPVSTLDRLYNKADPFHFLLPDWVRFRAWKVLRRLEVFMEHFGNVPDALEGCDQIKASDQSAEGSAVAAEVLPAVKICMTKLVELVRTLRYTADRLYLTSFLAESMKELKFHPLLFRPNAPASLELMDANQAEDGDSFLASRYGMQNLLAAVIESDNCINDILTVKEKASSMIYF